MIVLIAGAAGSGKSTVGRRIAGHLGWVFADGDTFHPADSVAKMRSGEPLTDDDRRPWLDAIAAWLDERIAAGEDAVLACSALKRSYRELLRQGRPSLRVVLLDASREVLARRLSARHGHFFPATLLDTQLADLELPAPSEPAMIVTAAGTPGEVAGTILGLLGLPGTGRRDAPGGRST